MEARACRGQVAGPDLPACGKCRGELDNSLFSAFFHTIFQIRFPAADLKQGFNSTGLASSLTAARGIPGKAHDAAGVGDIPQFRGQAGKAGLVLDDALVKTRGCPEN